MSLAPILTLIKADKVEDAFVKAQKFLEKTNEKESSGCYILRALNDLIYPKLQQNSSCESDTRVIFELSDLCSKWISQTWNCKHLVYMQGIYHIKRYLLKKGFLEEAKKLCSYFFSLYSIKKTSKIDSSENLVISNCIFNFANFLVEADASFFNELLKKNESSFFSLLKFHADLIELNAFNKLNVNFTMIAKFLTMLDSLSGFSRNIETVNRIFLNYADWFKDLSSKAVTELKLTEKDVSSFCALLYTFLHCFNEGELGNYNFEPILYCITSLLPILNKDDVYDGFKILHNVILLCSSLREEGSIELFSQFKNELIKKCERKNKTFLCELIGISFQIIFKMRSSFVKKPQFLERILPEFVSVLLSAYSYVNVIISSSKTKLIDQVNMLFTALYFTFLPRISPATLMEVFKNLRSIFKALFSIPNIVDKKGLLCFGVSGCINVLLTFNKNELFCQTATLGKSLIKYLLKFETTFLLSSLTKANISYALNAFVHALGKIGHYEMAQVSLIAFVGVHKELYEAVFTAWVTLKLSGSDSCYKETTVFDVVQGSKEAFENEWSFNVDLLDIDDLLLKEIKAYTKNRILHGEPVLAVYRTAAKVCKNKLLLAEILVCATDVVTVQPDLPNLNNFETSLNNVMQLLMNRQGHAEGKEKAHILCLLGNLHYQQARCEIMRLRKKSEAEVVQLELKPKNVVPILQANEGDVLNESTVSHTFMCLKLETQENVLKLLDKATYFWKKTFEIIEPEMEIQYFGMSFTYIKTAAYLYRLYVNKVKEIKIWELLYQLSEKLSVDRYKVLAVAELLSISLKVRDDWVNAAKLCLESNDFDKKSYINHLFIVNLAKNAFYNNKVEESLEIIAGLNVSEVRSNFLVFVQLQAFKSIFSSIKLDQTNDLMKFISPVDYKAGIILAVKVFENLLYISGHSKWNTFAQLCVIHCLLLDLGSFLGKSYSQMQDVRYARCYTKQQLLLAQRLALPIRVTELLIILAQLDVHCCNVMDFGVKLKGIETILELENLEDEMTYEEGDMNSLSASPALISVVKLKPAFSSHESSCLCFQCTNIDYQIQSLKAITLRASFFLSKNYRPQVKQSFKVGKNLIKTIYSKGHSNYKNLFTSLVEAEIRLYITVVEALGQWNSVIKAFEYCKIAKDKLNTELVLDPLLKNELDCYENSLKWMQCSFPSISKRDLTPIGKTPAVIDAVTPTNCKPLVINNLVAKLSPVPPIPVSPMLVTFRRRLDLDDSEDETSSTKKGTKVQVSPKTKEVESVVSIIENLDINTMPKVVKSECESNENNYKLKKKDATKKASQTERKAQKIKINLYMSPEAPNRPNRTPFKIYCDSMDNVAPAVAITTGRRGRPKRIKNLLDPSSCNSGSSLKVGRKLVFDSTSEVQEEETIKATKQEKEEEKNANIVNAEAAHYNPSETDSDLSVIEGTPPGKTKVRPNLKMSSLTPVSLLSDFEKLSLSNKSRPKKILNSRITRSKAGSTKKSS